MFLCGLYLQWNLLGLASACYTVLFLSSSWNPVINMFQHFTHCQNFVNHECIFPAVHGEYSFTIQFKCVGWPLSQADYTVLHWINCRMSICVYRLLSPWSVPGQWKILPASLCQPVTSVLMERNRMHFCCLLALPYPQKASNAFVTSCMSDNKI
jgi:hypothetical protein